MLRRLQRIGADAITKRLKTCRPLIPLENTRHYDHRDGDDKNGNGFSRFSTTAPLMGLSIVVVLRDFFGLEKVSLDDNPVKDKIKQSWLARKYGRYDEAIKILEEVLAEVKKDGDNSLPVTRVLDEIANTYYLKGDLENAESTFRFVIHRMITLHNKSDNSPEFIGISMKLADIFAQKGDLVNAETGYRHCVSKQMATMDTHLKSYFLSKGAQIEEEHKIERFGPKYSDPLALFGMCLEQFAHFLINYFDESREKEAAEYMDEVLKLSFHIYGPSSAHAINLLNNFGAACVLRNRFELAKKYLEVGAERILHVDESAPLIVGYYCNYAEALFHTGHFDEAIKYVEMAVRLSKSEPDNIKRYAERFEADMKRDYRRAKKEFKNRNKDTNQQSNSSWTEWLFGYRTERNASEEKDKLDKQTGAMPVSV